MLLKLSPSHVSQAAALTHILHSAKAHWGYHKEDMQLFRQHWQITPQMIEQNPFLTVTHGETPLGFAGLTRKDATTASLEYLFVLPQAHGQRIGKWLLIAAEEQAKRLGYTKLCLEADANAVPFYDHHGYQVMAQRKSKFRDAGNIRYMERSIAPQIAPLHTIDLKLDRQATWAFEDNNKQAINAHWAKLTQANPALWNGRILSCAHYTFADGHLSGTLVEASYAAFLAWRDWGFADLSARNLFGCTVLRSIEGHLIYGQMAGHTATAGQVYPPGGNLDLNDITFSDTVNILGSISRELEEETGFTPEMGTPSALLLVDDGPRLAVAQVMELPYTATQIIAYISQCNANSEEQELSQALSISKPSDLEGYRVPPHARALAAHLLKPGDQQ